MLRTAFLIGTTGFWLMTMSSLIQKEYFELAPIRTPYEVLPLHDALVREDYFATYLGDQRLGFTRFALEAMPEWKDERGNIPFLFRHVTFLSFLLLGRENEMIVKGEAGLSPQLYMQKFTVSVSTSTTGYRTEIEGEIINHNMKIKIKDKGNIELERVFPVSDKLLHLESLHYIWTPENLKIGKEGRFRSWNPLTLGEEDIHFRVDERRTVEYEGEAVEVFIVKISKDELETQSWITPEGSILRMENPSGLILVKQPAWQIFDSLREKRHSLPDLPNLFSIVPNRPIPDPAQLRSLKVKLIMPKEEKIIETQLADMEELKKWSWPLKSPDPAIASFAEPEDLIQSDDEEIRRQAEEIIGTGTSRLEAALRILKWVHGNVAPSPTASIPSAKQVLKMKTGDCNEYTVLFTALSRAAGIPTKMVAGLVYQDGRFFYHAWPEIYLDDWVGLDPTFNQAPVDAAHIPLVEGNIQQQVALASKLGNMKIEILETSTENS